MARRPKSWWHSESGECRVAILGERHHLGAEKDQAERRFHPLMTRPESENQSGLVQLVGLCTTCILGNRQEAKE
jgi:hypothetical protein